MTAVTNPSHDAFQKDDRLYRIYWAGEVMLPPSGEYTPRIRLWLTEVDDNGQDIPNRPIYEITESAGAIPHLPIGSYWRNGRAVNPKNYTADRIQRLEIAPPGQWTPLQAGAASPFGTRHCWINPSDMRLMFRTSRGRQVYGHMARVVPCRTTRGREVILPCYEIFRALLANTSDLSLALLGDIWNNAEKRFVESGRETRDDSGVSWHIDLRPGVPFSTVPYLALFRFVEDAREAANQVYPALVQQGDDPRGVWISARPPITGMPLRIRARTRQLPSRKALLVTQILAFEHPVPIQTLSYSVAEQLVPTGTPRGEPSEPRRTYRPNNRGLHVGRPSDRQLSSRIHQLPSMTVKWTGLPQLSRIARRIREVPLPDGSSELEEQPDKVVSVGEPSSGKLTPPARFSPQEEQQIEDRFESIRDLVDKLTEEGLIDSASEYPLVRPTPQECPTYCSFPTERDKKPINWAIIREPFSRPRLALVLELAVKDRLVYWIETEATDTRNRHRSLVIEMADGSALDEGVLTTLLDICALNHGVWPNKFPFGHGTVLTADARHRYIHGHLSMNVVLRRLAILERKKLSLLDSASELALN